MHHRVPQVSHQSRSMNSLEHVLVMQCMVPPINQCFTHLALSYDQVEHVAAIDLKWYISLCQSLTTVRNTYVVIGVSEASHSVMVS
jgi:hypothetical protein